MKEFTNKSFRIKADGIMKLDRLCGYMQNISRSDICAAALSLYQKYKDEEIIEKPGGEKEEGPLDACTGVLREFLRDSYKNGKTKANIKIVQGGNTIYIPKQTRITFSQPYTVYFEINRLVWVRLDLFLKMQVKCIDASTGLEFSEISKKWDNNELLLIDLESKQDSI